MATSFLAKWPRYEPREVSSMRFISSAEKELRSKKAGPPLRGNRKSNRLASSFNLLNNRRGCLSSASNREVSKLERLLTIIRPQAINSKATTDCQDNCLPSRASTFSAPPATNEDTFAISFRPSICMSKKSAAFRPVVFQDLLAL
jgi:hypothetical protein